MKIHLRYKLRKLTDLLRILQKKNSWQDPKQEYSPGATPFSKPIISISNFFSLKNEMRFLTLTIANKR